MDRLPKSIQLFIEKFTENNTTFLAAGLAYYFLLAIFPLLIVAFSIIPYFNISADQAMNFASSMLPAEIATLFEDNIVSLIEQPRGGLLTVGIIGALWSSSNGINAFIKSSNQAYDVDETRSFIQVRAISLVLTLGLILSVLVAMLLPVFGDVILQFFASLIGFSSGMETVFHILRWAISIIVLTSFLTLLYRIAPNKKIPLKHIFPTAFIAALLWLIISFGFSIYVSNFGNYSATYGSLGGIIILMIWFFLTGLILLIGATFTAMYHKNRMNNDPELNKAANI